MSDAVELVDTDIVKIGKDFKFVGYPIYKMRDNRMRFGFDIDDTLINLTGTCFSTL